MVESSLLITSSLPRAIMKALAKSLASIPMLVDRRRDHMYCIEINISLALCCLASPANFIYGRVLAKVLSHVTIMPVLLRLVNNFLGQVIGNASEL